MNSESREIKSRLYLRQLRVRSDVNAGESVEACQRNIAYYQKQYVDKCKKQGINVTVPYYG